MFEGGSVSVFEEASVSVFEELKILPATDINKKAKM